MSHYVKFTYQRALLWTSRPLMRFMAGHEGGIVTFGQNLEEAFDVLMRARLR